MATPDHPVQPGILDRDIYTVAEAATVLGVAKITVERMIDRGDLRVFKLGVRKIRAEWIEELIERKEQEEENKRKALKELGTARYADRNTDNCPRCGSDQVRIRGAFLDCNACGRQTNAKALPLRTS